MSKNLKKGGDNACDLNSICSRLHRVNGQINAIERMLSEKRDFVDILQQVVAARKAIDRVAVLVIESEANGCLQKKRDKKISIEFQRIVDVLFKTI